MDETMRMVLIVAALALGIYVIVRVCRFISKLLNGIRNGVREALGRGQGHGSRGYDREYRQEAYLASDEYYTYATAHIRHYSAPPSANSRHQDVIPARRADHYGLDCTRRDVKRLPRVTVEPQHEDYEQDYSYDYEPERNARARR